ncbi:MAG: hypothetical protein WBC91_19140 [Phototrophicaceae bacterium]
MSTRKRRDQLDNNFFESESTLPELSIQAVDEIGFGGFGLPNVQSQDGIVTLGAFRISMRGLEIQGNITQDEWWAFFDGVQKIESAIQFIIGDLANYGEDQFQISYDEIAEKTGYKTETVENYAYVARNVKKDVRNEGLSFNHHYLVASLDTDEQRQQWLATAKDRDLSVRTLELAINIWREGGDPQRVFDIVDDKPSPVQSARLKMVKERTKVMKKAKSEKARKLWLTYAKEQAAEWQDLVSKIAEMEDDDA